jgi:chorismate synthase
MGNTFGHLFRITTWGESHGGAVGVVVDGCPPRLALTEADIQAELDRRRPGQSRITTQRQEEDVCHILSGVFEGQTLGTPISILVWNTDAKPQHYAPFQHLYRPSHADYAYDAKYGIRNWQGGGRARPRRSGRWLPGPSEKALREQCGTEIVAYVKQIHKIYADVDSTTVTQEQVEANIVRCPDPACVEEMIGHIEWARRQGDSLGGVVEVVARQAPAGLGVPVFDKLEADLAKALMSLPASKGFEIGSGFAGTVLTGSEHNDPYEMRDGQVHMRTNNSGGIQGGISIGEPLLMRVAFKPTATIAQAQETVTDQGEAAILEAKGRHDPCVLPRLSHGGSHGP